MKRIITRETLAEVVGSEGVRQGYLATYRDDAGIEHVIYRVAGEVRCSHCKAKPCDAATIERTINAPKPRKPAARKPRKAPKAQAKSVNAPKPAPKKSTTVSFAGWPADFEWVDDMVVC